MISEVEYNRKYCENELDTIPHSWASASFKQIVVNKTNSKKKILEKKVLKTGKIPVVSQGQKVISGYTDDDDKTQSFDKPIIIFGDHTRIFKYIDFDFVQGADGVKVLYPFEGVLTKYLLYYFHHIPLPNKGYSRHYKFLEKCQIALSPREEQKRIVQKIEFCLKKIDTIKKNLTETESLLKKYRESILSKAFQGKLVPQDSNDEPASVLLSKIRKEREKNHKRGKKEQDIVPISEDEKPFDIPDSWEWVRLKEILEIQNGHSPKGLPINSDGDDLSFVKVSDMNNSSNGKHIDSINLKLSQKTVNKYKVKTLPKEAIIFPKRGGAILTNKKRILMEDSACDTNIMGLILPRQIREYFWWWFQSIHLATLHTGSTIPQVNNNDIHPLLFPLPPKCEQIRIVAVIKSKLKLIDSIRKNSSNLLILIKKSILNKAFEGRLVPQIKSEGTGHELLEKILTAKEASPKRITKKKKVKRVIKERYI